LEVERQRKDNPKLEFQGMQMQNACSEIALVLKTFSDGKEVPVKYVYGSLSGGRLPRDQGWSKR